MNSYIRTSQVKSILGKEKLYLFLLNLFIFTSAFSQNNLVRNGSFEEKIIHNYNSPNNSTQPDGPGQLYLCKHWKPFQTVDYFSRDTIDTNNRYSIPTNYMGRQEARTGNSYVGLVTSYSTYTYQEYIQCELITSLIKDSVYIVKFYMSLADSVQRYGSRIGLLFSEKSKLMQFDKKLSYFIYSNADAITLCGIGTHFSNSIEWFELSYKYTAKGGEKYLTIGNFKETLSKKQYKKELKYINNENDNESSVYYYLDDVSVIVSHR